MGTKSLPGQRHPSGLPWVHSTLWCWRPPVQIQGGTPSFGPYPCRDPCRDSLEMKKGAWELGLMHTSLDCTETHAQANIADKVYFRKPSFAEGVYCNF